ncbi:hypothetical protein Hanom_Chr16g01496731 [Helianthus anomalus]
MCICICLCICENIVWSKLSKWFLSFDHFCHFNLKLKPFEAGSLWFQFCCHFHPKSKSGQIFQLTSSFFVFFLSSNKEQNGLLTFYYNKLKKSNYFALH